MPFSSLYVSGKYASHTKHRVFQAIKPIIDFTALLEPGSMSAMKENIRRRAGCKFLTVRPEDLDSLVQPLATLTSQHSKINEMREERERVREELKSASDPDRSRVLEITKQITALRTQTYELEDQIVPIVLSLPNGLRAGVPDRDKFTREAHMNSVDGVKPFKQLDYRQLSYINNSVFASPVGPDSQFDCGRTAQLRYSIINKFSEYMRQNGFSDFSGLDFSKSAIVEAVRVKEDRDFDNDTFSFEHGYGGLAETLHLHLSGESSLESFAAYACKVGDRPGRSMRFFAAGSEYKDEADGPIQCHTVRSVSFLDSDLSIDHEFERLQDVAWNLYPNVGIPVRGVEVSAPALLPNECCRYDIQVYHPVRKTWKRVAFVANYSDFVPKRLGLEDKNLVSAVITDARILTQAIVETNQTETGSFVIPDGWDIFS